MAVIVGSPACDVASVLLIPLKFWELSETLRSPRSYLAIHARKPAQPCIWETKLLKPSLSRSHSSALSSFSNQHTDESAHERCPSSKAAEDGLKLLRLASFSVRCTN